MLRQFCLALCLAAAAAAADTPTHLVLRLSNIRQAQFAGYYVALEKGFYRTAGLDVAIRPGASNADGAVVQADPGTDLWSAWLPQALAARARGLPLVNIAQTFPHSGLEFVCRKSSGIHSPADLRGKTIAVWTGGARIPFAAWMRKLGRSVGPKGSGAEVTLLPIARAEGQDAAAPLLSGDAACISALNYDQYWSLLLAGFAAADLQIFHPGDAGVATLQDGLYATEASLADPARADALVRFVRASVQGWTYAVAHQPEAVAIVLNDGKPHDAADQLRQTRMMSAVARLTESGLQKMGYLEPAAFDRTVQLLLASGPDAPITDPPTTGAWTHTIWKHASR